MIDFILKYYRALSMAIVVVFSLSIIWILQNKVDDLHHDNSILMMENSVLEAKLKQKQDQLAMQNILIAANKSEYEEAMEKLPMKIETIKTKYVSVYNDIEKYKGEANASDCNGAIDKLNDFDF
jgi:predicted nuclease with TOPRIM domain